MIRYMKQMTIEKPRIVSTDELPFLEFVGHSSANGNELAGVIQVETDSIRVGDRTELECGSCIMVRPQFLMFIFLPYLTGAMPLWRLCTVAQGWYVRVTG